MNINLATQPKEVLPHLSSSQKKNGQKKPFNQEEKDELERRLYSFFQKKNLRFRANRRPKRDKMVSMTKEILEKSSNGREKKEFEKETKKIFGRRQSKVLIEFIEHNKKRQ